MHETNANLDLLPAVQNDGKNSYMRVPYTYSNRQE